MYYNTPTKNIYRVFFKCVIIIWSKEDGISAYQTVWVLQTVFLSDEHSWHKEKG